MTPRREVLTLPNGRRIVRPLVMKRPSLRRRIVDGFARLIEANVFHTLAVVAIVIWFMLAIVVPGVARILGGF